MRMRTNIFLFLTVVILSSYVKSQTKINLVLSVDEKIAEGTFMNVRLRTFTGDSNNYYEATYLPGSLFLPEELDIKNRIELVDSIHLLFNYSIACKHELKTTSYEIDFRKSWISNSYTVVKIFNTAKGKNRRKYLPLPSETYTYDVYYPGGSTISIRKRTTRQNCN